MTEQHTTNGGFAAYPASAASAEEASETDRYGRASGPRAGFWKRVAATLVDIVIVGVPTWGLLALVFGFDVKTRRTNGHTTVTHSGRYFAELLAVVLVLTVYYAIMDGGPRGQSVGKRVAGIRVVDAQTGTSIGYRRGSLRAAGKLVADVLAGLYLIGLLDYVWMLWDREKQALHDKAGRSYVVPVAAGPVDST